MQRVRKAGWSLAAGVALMALAVSAISVQQPLALPEATPDQSVFFETRIRPVLAMSCTDCHGKDLQLGGLRLDTRAGFQKGGESGPVLVLGNPEASLLIKAIRQSGKLKMPKGGMLKPKEIADFEAWVKMGAPWPAQAAAVAGKTRKPLWSLQPVVRPTLPKVKDGTWVRNPIDQFVLAQLEAKSLKPAAPADRRTLLRRLSYDLTGLPPTSAEVDAFLADKTDGAYAKVVDRLLASPRYGERWARHWLDVARYADTKGYVFEEDRNYYNAYNYRKWVIDAFNADLPYTQFVTQQLAADRIPEVQNGDDKRPLAALGFLTLGRRFLNQEPDIMDDRIDVTMRGFQGFTVACARCHDHKFDPIPTQDYYSLYAVFRSSQETTEAISPKPIRDPWIRNNTGQSDTSNAINNLILNEIKTLRDPKSGAIAPVKELLQGFREDTLPNPDTLKKLEQAFNPASVGKLKALRSNLENLKKNAPPVPELANAMADKPDPSDFVVFKRGNPGNPGDPAPRRFLAALSKPGVEREHWSKSSGRLELAQSIASRENPLTARVFVNRVWLHHFGAGIVRTPSDFGHQGEKPTDPALLDFLATYFMDNGWSIKKLHRLIVTSATYRQSSDTDSKKFEADPDNRLWGRMNRRRLDLEQMRDSVMVASSGLDSAIGGKSVDVWSAPFTNRRAVYGFIERQNLPSIFRTFDFASPESTNPQRFRTTVPQQALFFMNSPFSVEQARKLAVLPEITQSVDNAQRVRRLYRRLFGRLPDADETAAGLAYLQSTGSIASPSSTWQYGYGNEKSFTPMAEFRDGSYYTSKVFPDPVLNYLTINAEGGHPGRDLDHGIIRRWIAPYTTRLQITGRLNHPGQPGNGVRARIYHQGQRIGEWTAHHGQATTQAPSILLDKGDTVDFIVDSMDSEDTDSFAWTIRMQDAAGRAYDSSKGFAAPPPPPVNRLILYAQALMMTNEFMFVD